MLLDCICTVLHDFEWFWIEMDGWCWIVLDTVAVQQFCCLLSDSVACLEGSGQCWMV